MQRWRLLQQHAATVVASLPGVPPFTVDQLFALAGQAAADHNLTLQDDHERKILAIMIHNEAWRETVAAVPFERRLLLLPQCLRTRADCSAEQDAYGLLCRECGKCPLGALQREAVALGYVVLIAEGSAAVTGLLKEGNLDAVLGASCLPALEKSFRHIAEEAVPALAIPLLRDGCNATEIDLDMLLAGIHLRSHASARPAISIDALRSKVRSWFTPVNLRGGLMPDRGPAQDIALDWLAGTGKRWRPLLAASVYDALQEAAPGRAPDIIRHVAVASECFHKASLIHDDIEDGDDLRDGAATLHKRVGVAAALNAGDLLLGEGYRLLANAPAEPAIRVKLLTVAAEGHHRLCNGQGRELHWREHPQLPAVQDLIDWFRLKTAPAFEVAILLGAIAGGADESTCAALRDFSAALGIAYQVRDDLLDMEQDAGTGRQDRQSPSILLALLGEHCDPADRATLHRALRQGPARGGESLHLRRLCEQHDIGSAAGKLLNDYRNRALQALEPLQSIRLKSVLVRLMKRILPHGS